MYYRPTEIEIEVVLKRVVSLYPQLTKRAHKAAALLKNYCLDFNHERNQWRSWSLTDPRHSYHVAAGCTCPDHQTKDCPVIRGRKYCKHRIAALAYKRILQNHLNARICGSMAFIADQAKARSHSNELLLLDSKTGNAVTYAARLNKIPTNVCQIKWVRDDSANCRYDFRNDTDAAAFARWLDHAYPISQETEDIYELMRQSGFSHAMATIAAEEAGETGGIDARFDFPDPTAFATVRASA